jgi:hypothetical protein
VRSPEGLRPDSVAALSHQPHDAKKPWLSRATAAGAIGRNAMVTYPKAPFRAKEISQSSPNELICEWRRNACELIRISLSRYGGCHVLDIRTWVVDDQLRATKTGITLTAQKHLQHLAQGLADALKKAREVAIITVSEGSKP